MIDAGGNVVPVDAGAEKARAGAGGEILGGHGAEGTLHLELALGPRQIEEPLDARRRRHVGEERVDVGDTDRGQHRLAVG